MTSSPSVPRWHKTLCAVLIPLAVLRSAHYVIPFIRTHWLFSYEFGFLKRGLPGELLRLAGISTDGHAMDVIALVLFLVVAAALLRVFSIPIRKNPDFIGAWIFFLWAGTSSATLQRFAWDSGRYDGVGILLMLAGISISRKGHGSFHSLMLNILLGLLMLLIHEGQLLMFIPMMLAFWVNETSSSKEARWSMVDVGCAVFAFLLLTGAAVAISQLGQLQTLTLSDYLHHLQTRDPAANNLAAQIPLRNLAENQRYTLSLSFRKTILPHHILFLFGSTPLLVLWFRRFLSIFLRPSINDVPTTLISKFSITLILFLTAIAPLSLYLLAIDHFRWWALAFCNLFILEALLNRESKIPSITDFCKQNAVWIYACVACSLLLGSYGDTDSFALFKFLIGHFRT